MPKYKRSTEKRKAKNLTKPYIESGFNQSAVARQRGVTRQTINEQINSKAVQDILQEFLDNEKLNKSLITVAEEGLKATTYVGKKSVADHAARFRFWNGLMQAKGKIKHNTTKTDQSQQLHITIEKKGQILENMRKAFKKGLI